MDNISRQAAIEAIENERFFGSSDWREGYIEALDDLTKALSALPAVEGMGLWLVSRTDADNIGYDEYDASVIAAKSEDEALQIGSFMAREELLAAKLLGQTTMDAGRILASFNAG